MTGSGPTACWRWLSGDLTGEERGRDRGIPLAGHREPVRACPARPRRTGTRRSRSGTISRSTCPSTLVRRREIFPDVDSTDDPVHGNQEGRHFHGYYDCYLPLYREDLILCSRLRPANVDPAAGTAEELARERIRGRWPETVVRGDSGFCRDGTWCEDNGVDYLFGLSRNARLTERRQLRKSRRHCVSTGEASRRFCDFRYRTRTSWSRPRRVVGLPDPRGARFVVTSPGCKRAGARVLYEKLYCACGENRGAAARPVRRPDRDHAGEPVAPRLCDVRQPPGGDSEGWPGRHRGGQGAGRFGRNFSRSPSAFRFGGFCSRFRRSGHGKTCSPGSWRTCGCRRPQPDAARGPDSPLAGTPATGQVCSGAPRRRSRPANVQVRDWFRKKPCLPTAPCFPGPPVVPKTASATPTWPLDSLL